MNRTKSTKAKSKKAATKTKTTRAKRAAPARVASEKREFSMSALRKIVGKRGAISTVKAKEIRELIA